jgi:2-C-methyl-D-erythritol 4-phosphate cytidylyltransferase
VGAQREAHPGAEGARALVWAAVPAAGSGSRMASSVPKQYLEIAGRRLAEHTLGALLAAGCIHEIVVAIAPGDAAWHTLPETLRQRVRTVHGGDDRAASVLQALAGFSRRPAKGDWVLVHDMARPCVRPERIRSMIDELADDEVGGLLAVPLVDTLKRADGAQRVCETLDRSELWRAQTPQVFRFGVLERALRAARADGVTITDEAMAVERLGLAPRLLAGSADNIKVTVAEDMELAQYYLARRCGCRA